MSHRIDRALAEFSFEHRSCSRKRKYGTEGTALDTIARKERRTPGLKLYTYQCSFCHCWHLTKMEQGPTR